MNISKDIEDTNKILYIYLHMYMYIKERERGTLYPIDAEYTVFSRAPGTFTKNWPFWTIK